MTALQSLGGRLETVTLFPNAVVTATGAGSTKVDLAAFEGHALVLLNAAAGGSGVVLTAKLRHCDTVGGVYTDVTDGAFATGTANTAQVGELQINTSNIKQFVELYFTVSGGTGAGGVAAQIVAQKKYNH
jgi:hypothetical protein